MISWLFLFDAYFLLRKITNLYFCVYSKRCGFDGFLQGFCKVFVDFCRGGGVDLFVNALYSCAFV